MSTPRLVGLLGGDVRFSLSLQLHNQAFRARGLDWQYVPFPVPELPVSRLEEAVRGLRGLGFVGANVTMPHKERVMDYLDEVHDTARLIGAVNSIRVERSGRLIGCNTDAPGFLADLENQGVDWTARPALVLGAGGAGRAVAFALAQNGCPRITLLNRTHERAERLARDLNDHLPSLPVEVHPWQTGIAATVEADSLVVNCTSVGMQGTPEAASLPWPEDTPMQPGQVVVDLVYAPLATPLLKKARRDGAHPVSGLGMLVQQAALAFAWWTDHPPPVPQMQATAQACTSYA